MKRNWMHTFILVTLISGYSLISDSTYANEQEFNLENCHIDGIKAQVQCGSLQVPENYAQPEAEKIYINFAVLPAIDNSENKTPLMFLAGGPGQAAAELAPALRQVFNEVRKTRDLILVDQRGTGKSHPLECPDIDEQDVYQMIPEQFSDQEVKDCLAQFTGDLAQYNSENAIRDFDAVRDVLGHQQINIYGGSYGTRAGLVYMRMFPDSLRSVILDSVGPIEVPIGLFGQSSAQSFNLLLEHCQEETSCHQAYPNLAQEFAQLKARFDKSPVTVAIPHPRLGTKTQFVISKAKFIGTLFQQLYAVPSRSLVPLIIHQAYVENYAPLAGIIATSEGGMGIYTGLLFNITCNEDFPKITDAMFARDADNDFGGNNSQSGFKQVCPLWPQYRPSDAFYTPVTADIPTLILSGELDPVTPPSNGEYPANTLPNSNHIIVKNASHTVAMGSCVNDIVNEFLTSIDPKNLDESCLKDIPSETFMTSLNGGVLPEGEKQ
ncbi:MAG: alpha/beta hydrolase [Colwellia sp.]